MPKDPNAIAKQNAANWNKPGGGYDKWRQGDAAREKAMPVGTMLTREPMEEPKYHTPENHAPKGSGTTKYGDQMHGSYKQPWVEHDGVTDHQGDGKIG